MKSIVIRLIIVCIALVIVEGISYAKVDPGSIVGVWLLDEGRGDVVKDLSENKNDGKIVGAKWVDGKFGTALEFDGASHVEIPASASTDNLRGWFYLFNLGNAEKRPSKCQYAPDRKRLA